MPFARLKIFNIILEKLESDLQDADYKLTSNRRTIAKLAEEQKELKQRKKECGRLLSEFRKRVEDVKKK